MKFLIFFLIVSVIVLQGCSKTIMIGTTLLIAKSITDKRSINTQINDSCIEKIINKEINKKIKIKNKIRVVSIVYQKKILLTGQVSTLNLKNSIQNIVSNLYKNHFIYNFIKCEKPISYIKIFQDYLITLKTYLNLLINEKIKISNIKIFTENKEVFIINTTSKENKKNELAIFNVIKNIKEICNYFYV